MSEQDAKSERSLAVGQQAFDLIKNYRCTAYPRSYEVWYNYVTGHKPALNESVKKLISDKGTLDENDVDHLFNAFVSNNRYSNHAEKTSTSVLSEIDGIMEMIDLVLGSTKRYGDSLESLSADLSSTFDRNRIREIVESLVLTTRDTVATNRTLEARLKETRGEISNLRETLEAVRVESLTDPLTGVANRKHFEEMLIKSIDQAVMERSPLSLIVIDIDYFKRFNDTFGHLTGDQVLRLVGMTMREKVKSKATLARFGGEEFAVILPDTVLESARTIAETIRQSVMGRELVKRSTNESLGRVTVSSGVAMLRKGDTAIGLLERADQCMLAAKRSGRNRTVCEIDAEYEGDLPNVA